MKTRKVITPGSYRLTRNSRKAKYPLRKKMGRQGTVRTRIQNDLTGKGTVRYRSRSTFVSVVGCLIVSCVCVGGGGEGG
jgi:hypothetical protein